MSNREAIAASIPTPAPTYSSITINCDECGTGDYATIGWVGWLNDCSGYNDEWNYDLGDCYFDSNGHLKVTPIGGYEFFYFGANIVIYKDGASCNYYEIKYEGQFPCNSSTQHITFDIDYPWSCPEE